MTQEEIDEKFREVASNTTKTGNKRIKHAFLDFEEIKLKDSIEDDDFDFGAEQMCFASELMLKGNLVYDDFRRCSKYIYDSNGNCIVGTTGWNEALSSFTSDRNLSDMKDPKKILRDVILANNPNDDRGILSLDMSSVNNDKFENHQLLKAHSQDKKPDGHNLYALYQIQSPISRSLIDTEYYCKVNDSVKWTIIAILTDDIIKTDSNGKTIMPKKMMEVLDKVKEDAVDLRYSSISNVHVSDDQDKLPFLIDFSTSIQSVSNFRFPEPDNYKKIDFSNCNFDVFNNQLSRLSFLDKTTKYRLLTLFNQNEINSLLNFMNLNGNSIKLVYNAIYLKDYIKNVLDINLEFTEKQFIRINDLCTALKAYQLFDSSSKRLEDCISSSDKDFYINKCEEMSNSNLKIEHKNLFEELSVKYSEDEICSLLNSEEYKKFPHLFTANNCLKHGIDELKKFVSSDIFLKHKDLISSNNLLVNNDLIYIYDCLDDDFMNNYPGLICNEVLSKIKLNEVLKLSSMPEFKKYYSYKDLVANDYNLHLLLYNYFCRNKSVPKDNDLPSILDSTVRSSIIIPDHVKDINTFKPCECIYYDSTYAVSPIEVPNFDLDEMFRFIGNSPCDYACDEDIASTFQKECDIHGYEDVDINEPQKKK